MTGWQARNGQLTEKDGILTLEPDQPDKDAFLIRSQIELAAPTIAKITLRTQSSGRAAIAWRVKGDKDFLPSNRLSFDVDKGDGWQKFEWRIPATGPIIHLRIHPPAGTVQFQSLDLQPAHE